MRRAYGLLGVLFVLVFAGAFWAFEHSTTPQQEIHTDTENVDYESNDSVSMLKLTSPVFQDGGLIPSKYTCDGMRFLNPPLIIQDVPEGTESLVLVMDDPDIPQSAKDVRGIEKFDHFVLYNIVPSTGEIGEGQIVGTSGLNSAGNEGYTGPCPSKDQEPTTHRYVFRLYAISGMLHFIKTPTLDEVEMGARSMMLEQATLTGLYQRP